jgi:hypothetical protein
MEAVRDKNKIVLYTSSVSRDSQAKSTPAESSELNKMPRLLLSLPSSSSSVQPPVQTVKIISRSALQAGGDLKSLILKAAPITVQDIKTSGKENKFYI